MPPDARRNFALSVVTVAPSPADSGLTLTVKDATFPAPPFNVTVCPAFVRLAAAREQPDDTNATILRVTEIEGEIFTFEREQEGSSNRAIQVGDQIYQGVTDKVFKDIEAALAAEASARVTAVSAAIATAESAAEAASDALGAATAAQTNAEEASIPLVQKGADSGVMGLTVGGIGEQLPAHHASTHAPGGSDELTTADLPASMVANRPHSLGEVTGTPKLNYSEGTLLLCELKGATTFQKPENMPLGASMQVRVKTHGFALGFTGVSWTPSEPTFETGTSETYLLTFKQDEEGVVLGEVGPAGATGPKGTTGNTGAQGARGVSPWTLNGLGGWSSDPSMLATGTILTAGVLYLTKIPVAPGETLTNILTALAVKGEGLTAAECFAGVYIPNGANAELIGSTADQHTAWEATGLVTAALIPHSAGSLTIPEGVQWAYRALLSNGTKPPTPSRANSSTATAAVTNAGLTAATGFRAGSILTGQTSLPTSFSLAGVTSESGVYWTAWD